MGSVVAPRDASTGPGNVILFGVFAEVTEVRTSRRGHPGLGPQSNDKGPCKRRAEEKKAL